MKLSDFSIDALKDYFSGDGKPTPYRTGPNLVKFFNGFGSRDVYTWESGGGLPSGASRSQYAADKLKSFNGTKALANVILSLTDERFYPGQIRPPIADIVTGINGIIKHDGYAIDSSSGQHVIVGADLPDEVDVEVHFEEIERQLLEAIASAKFLIWVAVAWFTNRNLMRALYEKSKSGVNVQLIVLDDETNKKYGFEFEKFFETKHFKAFGKYDNIMHNKFAIIDLRVVAHGSYNWTVKANYNKETLSVESSRELAERYAEEFMNLKTKES